MKTYKSPKVNLKLKYRRTFSLALIVTLFIHLGLFQVLHETDLTLGEIKAKTIEIKVGDIPQTKQVRKAPPPVLPFVPVPAESEEVPEDVPIESSELELTELLPPPPPSLEQGITIFIPYEKPPVPIGGYAAIKKYLKYPELARKVGIEGIVIVGVLIDEKGKPIKTQVRKGESFTGFEKVVKKALTAVKWEPAQQGGRAVKVWVWVPVHFKLRDVESRVASSNLIAVVK